jgi:hypothetical protein
LHHKHLDDDAVPICAKIYERSRMGLFAAAQSVRICSTKSRAQFSHGTLGIEAAMLEAPGLDKAPGLDARGLETSGHDRRIADGRIQSVDREVH